MIKIVLQPQAELELSQAKGAFDGQTDEVSKRFAREVDRVFVQIASFPRSGAKNYKFRRCLCLGYPYAVIYKIVQDHILIVAFAHTSQRPGYGVRESEKSDPAQAKSFCIAGALN